MLLCRKNRSDAGSQAAELDYDVDEEYDNDYADNYFANGEGDDVDDLGGRSRYVYLNHADNNLFIDHIILLTTVGGDYDWSRSWKKNIYSSLNTIHHELN